MALSSVKDVNSKADLDAFVKEAKAVVLHFWASWCQASKQMDAVFSQLCTDTPQALFLRVEAEEQPDISELYGISAVPFFIFIKAGEVVDQLEGINPTELAHKVAKLAGSPSLVSVAAPASLGRGAAPAVLEAVQELSQADGSFILKPLPSNELLTTRLKNLVNSKPLMLFMKGKPDQPRCGFSRKVVDALKEEGADFGSFDILSDEEVREGLKTFSNWPTYPQLYVKGEFIGGCDIVLEMHKTGELRQVLQEKGLAAEINLESRLKKLINSSEIMLFMKGTPDEPRCGFSSKVVAALQDLGVEFGSFDILKDEEVRQGLKNYSNWPSYPQLYHKGDFLGGCDIVLEMQKNGELSTLLKA